MRARYSSIAFLWCLPVRSCVVVLLLYQLTGCVPLDPSAAPGEHAHKQVQMVNALTLKLWSEPSPVRAGENYIFLEVNAPTRKAMVNRDVWLTYPSAEGKTTTVQMQPVPGDIDIFLAAIELDAAVTTVFSALVQSPTKPPAIAQFRLPVVQMASTKALSIERADN